MVKERFFGLTNGQGNHGEDVKEQFLLPGFYAYAFLHEDAVQISAKCISLRRSDKTNAERSKSEPEYELIDTGIFDHNEYFDIFIEYAKESQNDILVKLTVVNKSGKQAPLVILPTVWFRNTWNLGYDDYKPQLSAEEADHIKVSHKDLEIRNIYARQSAKVLFCDNETNNERLYGSSNESKYCKDGINTFVMTGDSQAVSPDAGTKASFFYR